MTRNEEFNLFSGESKEPEEEGFSRQTFGVVSGLEETTRAVEKAENSKLQEDIKSAELLVNALDDTPEESDLIVRLLALDVKSTEVEETETQTNEEDKGAPSIGTEGIESKTEEEDLSKYRRNKKMRYGLKEVADVVFFDVGTKEPVILFDTLKVSNIENASESTQATGGQGNAPLIAWDYGRTATLTMQDALLSDQSMAMLSGDTIKTAKDAGLNVSRHEVVEVKATKEESTEEESTKEDVFTVELTHEPIGKVHAYVSENGAMGAKAEEESREGKVVTITAGAIETPALAEGLKLIVFYESVAPAGASVITFSSDKFPATYRVVGTSLVRDEDGVDHPFQFVIPRAKLQSGFTFTMDPENVSTFDFNLEVLVEANTRTLYDVIRLQEDKKE